MRKNIKFRFYTVSVEAGGSDIQTFKDVLKTVMGCQPRSISKIRDAYVYLHEEKWYGALFLGNMLRLRMSDVPLRGSTDGTVDHFDLEPHEGFGEQTAFLYSPTHEIVVLESNRSGVSDISFCDYYIDAAGLSADGLSLRPIVNSQAMKRLLGFEQMRSFEFSVAAPSDARMLKKMGLAPKKAAELTRHFAAGQISLTLSVGRDRSASLSQTVVEAVRELANMQGVKKLKVKGRNDHETVDFINDLMTYTARRAEDPELRRISGEARKAAAREAYDEKKKALQPYVVSRK